ncbi:polysaccharide lyase [Limnofasciculus baicalensis]|nr:hypothetical protein [Limnofasciculus baicalensis]
MKPKAIKLLKTASPIIVGTALLLLTMNCSGKFPTTTATVSSSTTDTKSIDKKNDNSSEESPPQISQITNSTYQLIWSGGFQKSDWQTYWGVQSKGAWGLQENTAVISDPTGKFAKVLRVKYPKGSASPNAVRKEGAPLGGAQFYAKLGMTPQDALLLSYSVRFSDNFEFVKGGKLPGLYGGTAVSGGNIPDGIDGFSTRFMWRKNGDGEVYAYLPTSTEYGTSIGRGNWRFQPGVWYKIEQEVTLNQPGKADGRVRVWLDNRLVLEQGGLTFRTVNTLKIEGIFFSTFFGGEDTTWAPSKDVSADFADFKVSKPSGVALTPSPSPLPLVSSKIN